MALFNSGNPTLTEKMFGKSTELTNTDAGVMTVKGTINKFGFLMLMVVGAASFNWHLYSEGNVGTMNILLWTGAIGGFILALIMCFKQNTASYLAPAYGILEGLFIGGLSAMVNDAFSKSYPGIVLQAVGLTFGVALAMYFLYTFRIIKATEKFKSVLMSATLGIVVFYGITMLLRMFGVQLGFMSIEDGGLIGIGISLFIVAVAALNLIMDFDMIEKGAEMGAPKNMEWYGAFGLLVTIVWLYIEMLKLLMRFANRK